MCCPPQVVRSLRPAAVHQLGCPRSSTAARSSRFSAGSAVASGFRVVHRDRNDRAMAGSIRAGMAVQWGHGRGHGSPLPHLNPRGLTYPAVPPPVHRRPIVTPLRDSDRGTCPERASGGPGIDRVASPGRSRQCRGRSRDCPAITIVTSLMSGSRATSGCRPAALGTSLPAYSDVVQVPPRRANAAGCRLPGATPVTWTSRTGISDQYSWRASSWRKFLCATHAAKRAPSQPPLRRGGQGRDR
jgi:hypothetical protein